MSRQTVEQLQYSTKTIFKVQRIINIKNGHNTIVLQYHTVHNRHQCKTDDGGQALGKELRHVHMGS